MKKFSSLFAAFMALSAVAYGQQPASRPLPNRAGSDITSNVVAHNQLKPEFNAQVSKQNVAPCAASFSQLTQSRNAVSRVAAAAKPFYTTDGFLSVGIFYNEEDNTFGYNYNASYLFGSSFTSKFIPQTSYTSLAYGQYDADEIGVIDDEGNFSTIPFGCPAGFYAPTMTDAKSRSSYTYGDLGQVNQKGGITKPTDSRFFLSNGETMPLGAYEIWSGTNFYSAYTNTPAYGSYGFVDDETGSKIASNTLMIDLGYLHGFVIENVQFPCINHADDNAAALRDIDTLWVTLYDIDPAGVLPVKTYEAVITADNQITDKGGWNIVTTTFAEIDEDGFESEISPIIYGEGIIEISGFAKEGMSCAIPMIYRAEGRSTGEDQFGTHSYMDMYVDGEVMRDAEGYVAFYGDTYSDAVVNFNGHFAYIGDAEGNFDMTGYVPADAVWEEYEGIKYTLAVSAVLDGKEYYDFDMMATDKFEEWEFETEDEDKILAIDVDSTYIAQYGIYMIYVAVTDKLEAGESTVLKIYDMGEVCSTITITNGSPSGIIAVNKDAEKEEDVVYNLQGIKVNGNKESLKSGLYLTKGKKFVL